MGKQSSSRATVFVPPLRDGVGASRVQWQGEWPSLLHFLCAQFPSVSEETWRSRFERQLVLDENGQPLQPASVCKNGCRIYYYRELGHETVIPFMETVIYQDEHILVADKPHFLPVIPSGRYVQQTLLVRLKQSTGITDLSPIHRIDKDTAGLVLFSINPATRDKYQALFRDRAVKKIYHAIASLLLKKELPQQAYPFRYCSRLVEDAQFFRTQEVQGETNSETYIEKLEQQGNKALYRLQPVTGRKHQLRVHMAALGIPICNDPLYPVVREMNREDFSAPLQLLAKSIAFDDPLTGEKRFFESRQVLQL